MLKDKFVNFMFYLFLFILFIVGLFSGNLSVKASMSIGSNSGWSSIDCVCPVTGECNSCTGAVSTGKIAFGTSSNTSGQGLTYKTTNLFYATYNANYSYTISFRTHFGGLGSKLNLVKEQVSKNKWSFWLAGYNNDNVGFSDAYITSANCSTKFDTTTNNGFITTCIVGVNTNLSRLRIEVNFFNNNSSAVSYYSDIYMPSSMRVDFISMEESQGIDSTINNSTNNIINNQNQNTQNIIDNINDNLTTKCPNLYNGSTHVGTDNKLALDLSNLTSGKTYTISFKNNVYVAKFSQRASGSSGSDTGPEKWSSVGFKSWTFIYTGNNYLFLDLTSSSGTHFITSSSELNNLNIMVVEGSSEKSYCKYGTTTNKIDDLNGNIGEVSNSINEVNDTINDDDIENPSSFLEDMADLLPSNGVITNLLTLPIQLFQKVLSSINGTCQSFNLGSLYGTNLIMPCIEVSNYLGTTLWNTIDLIISGVFVLTIAKKMIKAFENFTGMKEGDVIND